MQIQTAHLALLCGTRKPTKDSLIWQCSYERKQNFITYIKNKVALKVSVILTLIRTYISVLEPVQRSKTDDEFYRKINFIMQ